MRVIDFNEWREQDLMDEESAHRARYGRGTHDGAADSVDRGMPLWRQAGVVKRDPASPYRKPPRKGSENAAAARALRALRTDEWQSAAEVAVVLGVGADAARHALAQVRDHAAVEYRRPFTTTSGRHPAMWRRKW